MRDRNKYRELKLKYEVDTAVGHVGDLAHHYERVAREIRAYEDKVRSAKDTAERVKYLDYAIHYASVNVHPRLDLIAASMVKLTQIDQDGE